MKDKNIKLNIRFELAIEIILFCIIFILFGIAFLFASNLLSFNWISAVSILLGFILTFLKANSSIEWKENTVIIQYFKFFFKKTINVENIEKINFYKSSSLIRIKINNLETVKFYMNDKNREKLLEFIIHTYPEIPCLFLDRTDETAR